MGELTVSAQELANRVYIGPSKTGDNIDANRAASYGYAGGGSWGRVPLPLIDASYDEIVFGTYDTFGNPATITYKNQGTAVRTLTLTIDGSGNISDIIRT